MKAGIVAIISVLFCVGAIIITAIYSNEEDAEILSFTTMETIYYNNTINNTINNNIEVFNVSWYNITDIPEGFADGIDNTSSGGSSTGYPIYFTCGENSALDDGQEEWSCGGNGETGQEIILFEDVTLTHVGLDCNTNTGSADIVIRKNLVNTACSNTFTNQHDYFSCDVDFVAGDTFQPYTITDTGHSACVITMRFITI